MSLEDDLLAMLSDDEQVDEKTAVLRHGGSVRLQSVGDDAQMRVICFLPVANLCMLSQASRWCKEIACRDCTWRMLYLERWPDALGQRRDKTARSRGWKQVYAARDIETRTHEQEAKKKGNEEDEEEMAFRDMHAAERSLSLNRRFGTDGKQQSDLDEIRTCIRDFKSHIHFPEGGVDVVVKVEASSSSHHESATGMRGKDKFGRNGFFSTYTKGDPLMILLKKRLEKLPRQYQMEVCVCKLTGAEHFCCRDGSSMGCELSVPNDDGFFVCPVTGIIWTDSRHHEDEEKAEEEPPEADFEGGSKSFCNMVAHGYYSDKDPSPGWGYSSTSRCSGSSCRK